MKAVLIDAYRQSVVDVEISGDLDSIYATLGHGCQTFATAASFESQDDIFVDDEGLLRDDLDFGFAIDPRVPGLAYPVQAFFVGNGIVIGHNREGETRDAKLTAAALAPFITFGRVRQ